MNLVLSMNIRGLGAAHKFLALKELFFSNKPYIILLQESMHTTQQAVKNFRKMFLEWHIVATDSCGLSGGLAALWNPRWVNFKA